jgi:hypothetical protein
LIAKAGPPWSVTQKIKKEDVNIQEKSGKKWGTVDLNLQTLQQAKLPLRRMQLWTQPIGRSGPGRLHNSSSCSYGCVVDLHRPTAAQLQVESISLKSTRGPSRRINCTLGKLGRPG